MEGSSILVLLVHQFLCFLGNFLDIYILYSLAYFFPKIDDRAPAVDRPWCQMRKFRTNVSKVKALATSNVYEWCLKDLNLNVQSICQVGWMHLPLFITRKRGGVPSVEKLTIMLICLISSVN